MTTFTVTTAEDVTNGADGVLSLREAMAQADADAAADTIEFALPTPGARIILTLGQLELNSDLTIDGGAGVTIAGDQPSRVLEIGGTGTDVVLDHLTITGGRTAGDSELGGGILAQSGTTLTLRDSTLSGNGTVGGAALGGGLCSFGDVTLTNSTVSDNFTTGFAYGGGIFAVNVTLTNSTVSGNSTAGGAAGGGMWVTDRLAMTDSTVSGNSAAGSGAAGGGLYIRDGAAATIANTIVVGNAAPGGGPDISGTITSSNGHNLFGSIVAGNIAGDLENVSGSAIFDTTAVIGGTSVVAGVLADNGGPTQTIALLDRAANPALHRGAADELTTDQRGEPRPAPGEANPDIGAFELEQSHATALGTAGHELLRGSAAGEALSGLTGNDRLHGRAGSDLLDGGPGSDRLHAGKGGDVLIGGADADRFVFGAAAHSKPNAPDTILDFSRDDGDRIVLRRLDGDPDRSGNQKLEFIDRHAFTEAGQVRQASVDGHTVIKVNLDHDLHSELLIRLHDAIDLHRGDFLL